MERKLEKKMEQQAQEEENTGEMEETSEQPVSVEKEVADQE
jgi:hypothetical protein